MISPFAKHYYIDHHLYEFGPLLSLAETVFRVHSLAPRDANANNMMDSFNFQQNPQPPLIEPADFIAGESTSPKSNGYPNILFALLQNPYVFTTIVAAAAILIVALLVRRVRRLP